MLSSSSLSSLRHLGIGQRFVNKDRRLIGDVAARGLAGERSLCRSPKEEGKTAFLVIMAATVLYGGLFLCVRERL